MAALASLCQPNCKPSKCLRTMGCFCRLVLHVKRVRCQLGGYQTDLGCEMNATMLDSCTPEPYCSFTYCRCVIVRGGQIVSAGSNKTNETRNVSQELP